MPEHSKVSLAGVTLALTVLAAPALALAAVPAAHTPEALWQDFNGYWENMAPVNPGQFEQREQPLTLAYQAKKVEIRRNRAQSKAIESADNKCVPSGMPRMMIFGAFEVVVRQHSLGILGANNGVQIRNIWLDGRKHTPEADLFDTFGGESIGQWDGDTLVVDTVGIRPTNEFVYGIEGHKLHVVERFRKTGPDTLEVATTVTDPVVFTTPWSYTTNYKRGFEKVVDEWSYCVAALYRGIEKDGSEGFDLTPPPDAAANAVLR